MSTPPDRHTQDHWGPSFRIEWGEWVMSLEPNRLREMLHGDSAIGPAGIWKPSALPLCRLGPEAIETAPRVEGSSSDQQPLQESSLARRDRA